MKSLNYLRELVQFGYYEPYQITLVDMADIMRRNKVISEEDADRLHCTKEDEIKLKKTLVDNWDSLDEYDRAICHVERNTSKLGKTM